MNFYLSKQERYRINIIFVTIMLAYALGIFVQAEGSLTKISFLGLLIPVQIKFQTLISIAVSGLTASGCIWFFNNHSHSLDHSLFPHILLPTFSAWSINIFFNAVTESTDLWIAYFLGGITLLVVILAEYFSLDELYKGRTILLGGLNSLSFILFFLLLFTLDATDQRIIFKIPILLIATGLISIRTFHISNKTTDRIPLVICTSIIVMQFATALHYINISSIDYGLIIIAPLFSFLYMMSNYNGTTIKEREIKIGVGSLLIIWILAIWI